MTNTNQNEHYNQGMLPGGFVDIHTHILPGVDDGSPDYETSVQMLQDAYANGTGTVVLTPHYKRGYTCGSADGIRARFAEFQNYIAEKLPVTLYLGTEAMYEMDLPQKLLDGEVLTMADSAFVLVEFRPSVSQDYLFNGIFSLTQCGYVPILAHVERYECLKKEQIPELIELGARIQVNVGSVMGAFGFRAKHFCRSILKAGYVDYVASDAHDTARRTAQLRQCAQYLEKRFGDEYADYILRNGAAEFLD